MKLVNPKLGLGALLVAVLAAPHVAHATVIGALTIDSTYIIKDTRNNYEWLRWDVLKDATYQETLNQLGAVEGGGWSIAGVDEAGLFVDALLDSTSHNCAAPYTPQPICGTLPNYNDGDLGNSSTDLFDKAFFLTQQNSSYPVGEIGVYDGRDEVFYYPFQHTLSNSDYFSATGSSSGSSVGWLLYRGPAQVPEPATILLVGLGLVGLGAARRRTKGTHL